MNIPLMADEHLVLREGETADQLQSWQQLKADGTAKINSAGKPVY